VSGRKPHSQNSAAHQQRVMRGLVQVAGRDQPESEEGVIQVAGVAIARAISAGLGARVSLELSVLACSRMSGV